MTAFESGRPLRGTRRAALTILSVALPLFPCPIGAQTGIEATSPAPGVVVATDTVWRANATAFATPAGVVVVDNFMLRTFTRTFRRIAEETLGDSVVLVVNTHGHDDHTWGSQVFPAVTIVAHDATSRYMRERIPQMAGFLSRAPGVLQRLEDSLSSPGLPAERRLELERRRALVATNLERHGDIRITPPNRSITRDTTLNVGGVAVRILAIGRAHSAGDVAVLVPARRTLVVGDLARARGLTGLDAATGSLAGWIDGLERLVAIAKSEGVAHVVPGHGQAGGPEILSEALEYWSTLATGVARARARGLTLEDTVRLVTMSRYAGWIDYPQLHRQNVEAAWNEAK